MSEYVSTYNIAKSLGLNTSDSIMSMCKFLDIDIITKHKGKLKSYIIKTEDVYKIHDFMKLHPDKKERTDFLRMQGRIRNFGSWENYKKSLVKKYKKSCLEKYGVDNSFKNKEVQERAKETCLKKYGAENVFASDYGKAKIKETMLEKYGVENPTQSTLLSNKAKQTNIKRYGVAYYSQTKEFQHKRYKHFCYDNEYFDSSWELAVWVYCKDHGIIIEREPCSFDYEYKEKHFTYYPDFRISGKLVEIKGEHLLKKLQNTEDSKDKAKYLCMCKHGVEIWGKSEVQQPLDYVKEKYGCEIYNTTAIIKDKVNRYVTDNFIKQAKDLFGDVYNYSKVECSNSEDKVTIICPKHGDFIISASHHLEGQGCPKCTKVGNKPISKEEKRERNRHIKLAFDCGMKTSDIAVLFGLSLSVVAYIIKSN